MKTWNGRFEAAIEDGESANGLQVIFDRGGEKGIARDVNAIAGAENDVIHLADRGIAQDQPEGGVLDFRADDGAARGNGNGKEALAKPASAGGPEAQEMKAFLKRLGQALKEIGQSDDAADSGGTDIGGGDGHASERAER